jgi:hypothetical protein
MEEKRHLICNRCRVQLVLSHMRFNYLEFGFEADLWRCPKCGQPHIPESLVDGRIAEVERMLEDK